MANKSIFVDNINGVLRNMPPMDLIKSMQIAFDEYEKNEVAKFQETFIDKYFTFNPMQMSLTAEALMGRYNFRIMASVIGNEGGTPLRASKGFDVWTKEIPRIGHKYPMTAKDLRTLYSVLENARVKDAAKLNQLEKSFIASVEEAYMGCKDTLDYIVLYALFNKGVVNFTPEVNNPQGIEYQIDYKMPADNQKVSPKLWNATNSAAGNLDIFMWLQDIVQEMSDKGIDCGGILIDPQIYTFILRETNVRKQVLGTDRSSAMVTNDQLQNALASYGIPELIPTRRRMAKEEDGVRSLLNPVNLNNIVFLPSGKLGEVQPSVEDSDLIPEENVSYIDSAEGIKVSKWSVGDSTGQQPTEYTQAAGRLLPIITEIKGVYSLQVRGFVE